MGCSTSKESLPASTTSTYTATSADLQAATPPTSHHSSRSAKKAHSFIDTQLETKPEPLLDENGKPTLKEIQRRTTSCRSNTTITVGDDDFPIQIEYAYWSQRGYYPDEPHKENQDAWVVPAPAKVNASTKDAVWGVLDGHGKHGHDCSAYAKQNLPRLLEKHLRQARVQKYKTQLQRDGKPITKLFDPAAWPLLNVYEYQMCCYKAFNECNREMHKSSNVHAKLSGTTATLAALHGNLLTVANVGDSRVILGHRTEQPIQDKDGEETKSPIDGDHILAIPLSRDQTPYRKDERDRIARMGGSVLTIGQMEAARKRNENNENSESNTAVAEVDHMERFGDMVHGKEVDASLDKPRVWLPGQNYPGCAFTRSLGDGAAEAIGVIAEPEMLSRQLTENDEILIIASDGIFEFMTNQEVIDMSRSCGSPRRACECLVEKAYNLWMKYEPRSDDITIIVCFLKCSKPVPDEGWDETTESLVDMTDEMYGVKPVRRPPGSNEVLYCTPDQDAIASEYRER